MSKQSVHRNVYVVTLNGKVVSVATSLKRAQEIATERTKSF
jgi:hypothetical protein